MGDRMRFIPLRRRSEADRLLHVVAASIVFGIVIAAIAPRAYESGWLLAKRDDPAAIAERRIDGSFTADVANREIAAALAADDADLANSFVALARDRGVAVDPALLAKLDEANGTAATAARDAQSFAQGLVTGEPDDVVGFAGTALGDLFVFGDIRDAVREGTRLATGQQADELILGLACVGIAVTAGTYASMGLGTPARVGLSLVKAARKTGSIGGRLAATVVRMLRGIVDWSALRRAFADASVTEPAVAVRAAREAIKTEKVGGLTRLMTDVGTVQAKAGTRATLEGLKLAESPAEVGRLAKLAEKEGGKTRAILKLAGRAAFAFAFVLFDLASWLFWFLLAILAFCTTVKHTTEHATRRYVRWRKRRRAMREIRDNGNVLQARALLASSRPPV